MLRMEAVLISRAPVDDAATDNAFGDTLPAIRIEATWAWTRLCREWCSCERKTIIIDEARWWAICGIAGWACPRKALFALAVEDQTREQGCLLRDQPLLLTMATSETAESKGEPRT